MCNPGHVKDVLNNCQPCGENRIPIDGKCVHCPAGKIRAEDKKSCQSMFNQRRLDPGMETLEGFFQVGNQKEYQNVVIISFVHLEKINIFCFMHKSVAQKLSLPRPLEN